jgi:hypothetical protein
MQEGLAGWMDLLVRHYHVNPFIFLGLYGFKSVVWWWTMIAMGALALRRAWGRIPPLLLLNVTTNVSPYAYVYFFGRNLPWWFPYLLASMAGGAVIYLGLQLYLRLNRVLAQGPPG